MPPLPTDPRDDAPTLSPLAPAEDDADSEGSDLPDTGGNDYVGEGGDGADTAATPDRDTGGEG